MLQNNNNHNNNNNNDGSNNNVSHNMQQQSPYLSQQMATQEIQSPKLSQTNTSTVTTVRAQQNNNHQGTSYHPSMVTQLASQTQGINVGKAMQQQTGLTSFGVILQSPQFQMQQPTPQSINTASLSEQQHQQNQNQHYQQQQQQQQNQQAQQQYPSQQTQYVMLQHSPAMMGGQQFNMQQLQNVPNFNFAKMTGNPLGFNPRNNNNHNNNNGNNNNNNNNYSHSNGNQQSQQQQQPQGSPSQPQSQNMQQMPQTQQPQSGNQGTGQ